MVVIIIILSLIVVNDYKQLNKKDITKESSLENEETDSYSVLSIMIENDAGASEILGADWDYYGTSTPENTYKGSQTTIAKLSTMQKNINIYSKDRINDSK